MRKTRKAVTLPQKELKMPRLSRTAAVKVMEAVGYSAAGVLSTNRLEKKVNRLHLQVKEIDEKEYEEEISDLLDFITEALFSGERIEIDDDRDISPVSTSKKKRVNKSAREFTGTKNKYDWNSILSGEIVMLEQGTDYDCKSTTFALQCRAAAKRKKVQVRIKTESGRVIVQAVKD